MVKRVKWIRCESNGQLETAAERPAGKKEAGKNGRKNYGILGILQLGREASSDR